MIQTVCLLILLITLQFFSGWAVIHLIKLEDKPIIKVCLSLLLGMFVCSLTPLFLEMAFIKINLVNFLACFLALCLMLNFKGKAYLRELTQVFNHKYYSIKLYEWLFIIPIGIFLFISAWRCYYTPPTPRDIIVGAELLAKYAVKEGTIISSVFTDNIRLSSNNPFKPPYVLNLQIAYKLIGFEFGKIWLIQNVLTFIVLLYTILKERLHPILVGTLLILFIAIPDMYAYTFIILYDYSNAICFSLAVYFLQKHFDFGKRSDFLLSSILLGAACFIRSETLYFIGLGLIIFIVHEYKKGIGTTLKKFLGYMLFPALCYIIWMGIFVNFYLPVDYAVSDKLNTALLNWTNIKSIFHEVNSNLIWGDLAHSHYAYFIDIFAISTIAHLIIFRSMKGWQYMAWILIIYFGYIILANLLPLIEIDSTVKRGFFKMFPLMLIYYSYNGILLKLSKIIYQWESSPLKKEDHFATSK